MANITNFIFIHIHIKRIYIIEKEFPCRRKSLKIFNNLNQSEITKIIIFNKNEDYKIHLD